MTRSTTSGRNAEIHDRITTTIIEQLAKGVRPWSCPWAVTRGDVRRPLRHNGEHYNGINTLLLWIEATAKGFTSPTWMTFRQALALGGHVRKGEHGATVVYANRVTRTETRDDGEDVKRHIPFLKAYTVFCVDQIDDLPDGFTAAPPERISDADRVTNADRFFAATGLEVVHGGDGAFYAPGPDRIHMPLFGRFDDAVNYYVTLGHEAVHATGHPSRLDRDLTKRFDTKAVAAEELIAELGAAFLAADLGLTLEPREDHAAYIGDWLEVLSNDKRFIVQAAAQAQRAVDWLHGRQ